MKGKNRIGLSLIFLVLESIKAIIAAVSYGLQLQNTCHPWSLVLRD